ncbi:MAG: signal peptidase II [bacterium]|nr:signal peptidase II [bacterium]
MRLATALSPRRIRATLIAGVVVTADQVTKVWARTTLADHDVDLINGFLRLHLAENPGSAFSLFQSLGSWLGVAAILASGLIVVLVERTASRAELAGFSLILGGAVGNLVDRVVKGPWLTGSVTDFVDFSFWPNFNVADSAITIGVVVLLWAANRSR